jgi:hypothetical protein
MFLYADTTGTFNYTSLKTELEKEIEGIAHNDLEKYSADKFENDSDLKDYWFNTFNITDMNTIENISRNYGMNFNYYDTANGKKLTTLNDGTHPLSDLSAKDQNKTGSISHRMNMGYLTEGNMHSRYYDALAQNDYLRHNFFGGFTLELNINALSHPRLLSKVNVIVPSMLGPGNNEALSKEYMIVGVVHDVKIGDVYRKRMILARNGFNKAKNVTVDTVGQTSTIPNVETEVLPK